MTRIYNYYKKFGYKTQVMGASFRNVNQIVRLTGSDLLTISPDLLDQLEQAEGTLDRKLDPAKAQTSKEERLHLDEKTFRWMHNEDVMATEKLAEGIRKFNSDTRHLEDYALSQAAQKVGLSGGRVPASSSGNSQPSKLLWGRHASGGKKPNWLVSI